MRKLRCVIAKTQAEIAHAQRLRWQVYGVEEGLLSASVSIDGREVDAYDDGADALSFVVYADDEPAGTVRLLLPAEASRRGDGLGLGLDAKLDLAALAAPGFTPAEVTRFCVPRRYRCAGSARALFHALARESRRLGITHWLAGANMATDVAEDAAIIHGLVRERGFQHPWLRVDSRADAVPESTPERRPFYTDEQRARAADGGAGGLPLPGALTLFATRMGARFIGSPFYDAYFGVYALPLIADVDGVRGVHDGASGRLRTKERATAPMMTARAPMRAGDTRPAEMIGGGRRD